MLPRVGSSSPVSSRNNVVLPEPLRPTMPHRSPGATVNETFEKRVVSPKSTPTPANAICVMWRQLNYRLRSIPCPPPCPRPVNASVRPGAGSPGSRRQERAQKVVCSLLRQVIVQRERVLHTMAHGRSAVSTEALELSSCGTRDHRKGLLRLAVLEYPDALKHKGSGLGTDSSNDSLEADERSRAILQIHH